MTQRLPLGFLTLLVLLLHLHGADAQCYLLDANAPCAVCWKTEFGSADDTTGVTTMKECPDDIKLTWSKELPKKMFGDEHYLTEYDFRINTAKYPVIKKGKDTQNDIPHANIHSCIASRGACTPFVANSPGLATHTPSIVGDLVAERRGYSIFNSTVTLKPEVYTIIAHIRFFTPNTVNRSLPDVKYDVAIGISREVLEKVAEVTSDTYLSTGILGGALLSVFAALAFAARRGYLNIDMILETLYAEEITVPIDIFCSLGDVSAFTVSVFTSLALDNKVIQILPAAYLFLCIAWLGSLYNAYQNIRLLHSMYQQAHNRNVFIEKLSKRLAHETLNEMSKGNRGSPGRRISFAGSSFSDEEVHPTDIKQKLSEHVKQLSEDQRKLDVMMEMEMANREIRRKRGDVITILGESLPVSVIQCYVLMVGQAIDIVTLVTLLFATVMLGAKLCGLGSYRDARIRRDKAKKAFHETFEVGSSDSYSDMETGGGGLAIAASGHSSGKTNPLKNVPLPAPPPGGGGAIPVEPSGGSGPRFLPSPRSNEIEAWICSCSAANEASGAGGWCPPSPTSREIQTQVAVGVVVHRHPLGAQGAAGQALA